METEVYRPGIKRSWFALSTNDDLSEASAYIYDDIGGFGIKAKDFIEEVASLKTNRLNVHINSYGGEIDEGVAIYNFLNRYNGEVVIKIDGIAASIASIIAMAGDKVVMPKSSLMFIHNPWTMTAGDAASLQKEAEQLEKRKSALMSIYAEKTGLPSEFLSKMMDDETLLTAEESVAMKFADEIEQVESVGFSYNAALYNKVLVAMSKKLKSESTMAEENKPVNQEPVEQKPAEVTPDSKTDVVNPDAKAEICPNCGKDVATMTQEEKKKEEEMVPVAAIPSEEVKPEDKVEEVVDARAEFKEFVASFGADRAAKYYGAGLSMADAKAAYLVELEKENAELKSKMSSSAKVAPVAVTPSDKSDAPVMFTREQIRRMSGDEYRKLRNEINKAQIEGRIK